MDMNAMKMNAMKMNVTDVSCAGMKLDASMLLVPTNLPGIFEKVRDLDNGAESSSIAPLIHSGLLARLQETDTPAARAFRERILARRWRPENQINPLLQPQIGVTHQLTDRVQTQNASFTSANWAGGEIKGAWTAAVGIWRVPFVSKPSAPPGTSGGWISSSWVGIDGDGSNDVLQAGVRQDVSGSGDASYFPWFEWFLEKPKNLPPGTPIDPQGYPLAWVGPDGKFRYIYATKIDNMLIEPGDEVFCGVYYVAHQGEIIFGNVDRRQYFSMVLAPPPGASFSGNVAEWIMEAPNTGEPNTSLPRFTPVVFSAALATGQSTTTGDPANGDVTNILRGGVALTSVSLGNDSLEIDDQESPIAVNLPNLLLNNGEVLRWRGIPDRWDRIGNDGRIVSMAAAGNALYLRLNDGEVLRWLGSPDQWKPIGNDGRIVSMTAAGTALYLLFNDGEVFQWQGSPDQWKRIGNDGRIVSMTAAGTALYLLLNDGEVLRWLGSPDQWERIGNDGRIVSMEAAGLSALYLHLNDGEVLRWRGSPDRWDRIGNDGRIVSMAAAGSALYLHLNDGEVLRWRGIPDRWDRIGNDGRIVSMAAAGNALYLRLNDGEVLRWLGSPDQWKPIGNDGRIVAISV
jgi:hypothetical protein